MLSLSCATAVAVIASASDRVLFAFTDEAELPQVAAQDVEMSTLPGGGLRFETGARGRWPGVRLTPAAAWDLSEHARIEVDVRNSGEDSVVVFCRVDNPGGDGATNSLTTRATVPPGAVITLNTPLRGVLPGALAEGLYGMRGFPGGFSKSEGIDPSVVTQLIIFTTRDDAGLESAHVVDIMSVTAAGAAAQPEWLDMPVDDFYPFIDRYGQFAHAEWPGKVHSDEDLVSRRQAEDTELAAKPGPDERDEYGGWAAGPQLDATGFFRVEKVEGKWWLVDPNGRLFWSHGVDCVRPTTGTTPITDREHYFADLPVETSPLAAFYGWGNWGPHGYYAGRDGYRDYNLGAANLARKYGDAWRELFAERAHRRLRSWGLNTIANWSDPGIYRLRRTPYVATLNTRGRDIEGSEGFWRKFPDPFDDGFVAGIAESMEREADQSAGDPWCIGYFVDNELSWGDETALASAALMSPPNQPAKIAAVSELRERHGEIATLNEAWGVEHGSWDALLSSRDEPPTESARDDLRAINATIADRYFRVIREALKRVAPNQLYLGCRFAWANPVAVQAAAKHCDVVAYNLYRRSVADFAPPLDLDIPIIIGEFHFGALDRGMFHTGLQSTESQDARAEAYRDYVNGALANPHIVGTHWFQFGDQATTGRGDGENYQIGFLDIADTPYPETISAVRDVGYAMYATRYRDAGTR